MNTANSLTSVAATPLEIQRIYLASRSPRRRELLTQLGVKFDPLVIPSGRNEGEVDETPFVNEEPYAYVERVTRAKAVFGANLVQARHLAPQPILAADTTVCLNGEIFGKPADEEDAKAMLRRLSGTTHQVLTGVALVMNTSDGEHISYLTNSSEVRFRVLSDDEITAYVKTGEPMDKAGAYGIQGRAGMFVEHLCGSYTGVMGLPVFETAELLKHAGYKFR